MKNEKAYEDAFNAFQSKVNDLFPEESRREPTVTSCVVPAEALQAVGDLYMEQLRRLYTENEINAMFNERIKDFV